VATTDTGYTFPGETSHDFGKAPETNVAPCLIEVPVPAAPGVTDPCDPGNASWRVPGNGNNVTWSLDGDGNLMATVDPGHTFHDGKATHNFGKAPETNKDACPAVLASVAVAAPVLTPPTCTAAGELKYDEANGYAWNRKDDNGVVVLTAIAKPGFTLVGQTSWTYTVAQLAQLHGAKDCPPAVIPPEVEGVKNTAPPTPPVVKGVKHEAAAPLPRTGFESGLYGAAGLLLLLVGSGLVLATRQRSTQDRAH
jgi:LPXTG-motif cell wall-anchored protein